MFLMRNYTKPTLLNELLDSIMNHNYDDNIDYQVKSPTYDVIDNDDNYVIEVLLAGIKKENIKIDTEDNVLTIYAERKLNNKNHYSLKQTYFGKYEKSFILPEDVDISKIDANLSDGILTLKIGKLKKEEQKKRLIEIK